MDIIFFILALMLALAIPDAMSMSLEAAGVHPSAITAIIIVMFIIAARRRK